MITWSPRFQFTGVATLSFAVSCSEPMAAARRHGIRDSEL
jgi:hypothetical protein